MAAKIKKSADNFQEIEIGPDVPIYTSGVVCSILAIPIWVLKQLDKEGIVSPPRKAENATRIYSKREIKKVQHCWYFMKEHKVKITGLKVILKMKEGTFRE